MKRITLLFFFICHSVFAQNQDKEKIYTTAEVDTKAGYEQGDQLLKQLIVQEFRYPEKVNKCYGTKVVLKFVINKEKSIRDIKVLKTSGANAIDQEVIRIIKEIKHWKPAQLNGKDVNSYFILPVRIALE